MIQRHWFKFSKCFSSRPSGEGFSANSSLFQHVNVGFWNSCGQHGVPHCHVWYVEGDQVWFPQTQIRRRVCQRMCPIWYCWNCGCFEQHSIGKTQGSNIAKLAHEQDNDNFAWTQTKIPQKIPLKTQNTSKYLDNDWDSIYIFQKTCMSFWKFFGFALPCFSTLEALHRERTATTGRMQPSPARRRARRAPRRSRRDRCPSRPRGRHRGETQSWGWMVTRGYRIVCYYDVLWFI